MDTKQNNMVLSFPTTALFETYLTCVDANSKPIEFYTTNTDLPHSLITAERKEHAILRRQLSHGFSDKSMREQESLIKGYVELLIQRLHENAQNGAARLNMRDWYNWTTFDVIGDLGFGRSFGCLEGTGVRDTKYHFLDSIRPLENVEETTNS